jgi:phosphoglycolate phosphatase-like HAD superfamily hydrolase
LGVVILDLVSTLIDSGPRYIEAYMRVASRHGHATMPSRTRLRDMLGERNLRQIVTECSPEVRADGMAGFMHECNAMCDTLLTADDWEEKLYPDTRGGLNSLRTHGHALGVFTGTRETAMLAQIYHHRLSSFFHPAYLRGKDNLRDGMIDSVSLKKAQLSSIRAAYATNGGAEQEIAVIGDSPADCFAAKSLGIGFTGIARDGLSRRRLEDAGAGVIVATLSEAAVLTRLPPSFASSSPVAPEARSAP